MGIVDILLSLTNDKYAWNASLPIGSESIRIVELIKRLSATLFDFQKLNYFYYKDEDDEIDIAQRVSYSLKNISKTNRKKILDSFPPYVLIELKYEHIGKTFFIQLSFKKYL